MTWVFPPETYSTTGFRAPVISRPISMSGGVYFVQETESRHVVVHLRPTQWLTPTSGLSNRRDSVRATRATDCSGAPMPGPTLKLNMPCTVAQIKDTGMDLSCNRCSPDHACRRPISQ